MTSTTTFGGFNPESRNSSKVLKPPGGGSSDIFGAGSGDGSSPRRVKNHQQSNLFLSDEPSLNVTPSRAQGKDTYSRLFGASAPPDTPSGGKNRMKSNILLAEEDTLNMNTPRAKSVSGDSLDGERSGENGHAEEVQMNGNGNGNGGGQPAMSNGNAGPMNGNGGPAQPRARVPPGGFSSGLW